MAAAYIFNQLEVRHGQRWVGSRRQGREAIAVDLRRRVPATELLHAYQLFGVCADAHAGLLGWLEGRYPLICREDIPSPLDMLDLQCTQQRYVTLMLAPEDQNRTYGRHAGALEFLLHDLEHAHKYFADPVLAAGQQRFFCLLRESLGNWPKFDRQFQNELDYVLSDMNSHPLHMLKYLKAIWLNAFARAGRPQDYEEFCSEQFSRWSLPLAAAMNVNSPGREGPADHLALTGFYLSS